MPELVDYAATAFGPSTAIVDGSERIAFAELPHEVRRWSRALLASGLQPGDRVGLWAPNSAAWILAALGTMCAGGTVVPINTRFKGTEASYILGHSDVRILFTVTDFLGVDYVQLLREVGLTVETTVVLDGPVADGTIDRFDFLARGDSVPDDEARHRARSVGPDDISDVMFTSGTTGRPKGAMVTHGQNLRIVDIYTEAIGLRPGDVYLIVNPFFHSFGFKAGWLSCLLRGATALPHPVFDADEVMSRIERERVTVLPGPPTLLHSILEHPSRPQYDLSSLRLTVTGAASIPVELIRRVQSERLFDVVLTAYGLTESSAVVSVSEPGDDAETIANWSGRVIPGVEVRIVDDNGAEVPLGEPGEILVRGFNVMRGYLDDPDATAAAIDHDGWLHSGDIGVMNERGYLRITDRKKDMFIVGGFNAYPAEIEDLLLAHPDVSQVAVVGVPDERLGEVGMAFVVPAAGTAPTGEDIIAFARTRMANFKVPRRVAIVDALPVNASGKVLKYELRASASSID
ncbi:MAG: FadD3 family acyl-CoA ligase [Acidimicrobiales bacterium]|nr:FadD3 family acyl-CoA ligase [Acidimicrobiales bacterium]